ncbi:MAG: hypothetical protein OXD46_09590 [Chloroflexi bacterium]|nr:hypothetical protein [Chloroflexota bacterium]
MNIWGERFADVRLFIGYCRDLNVDVDTDELEHYERIGAMLPVARVMYPDDYIVQTYKSQTSGAPERVDTGQWPALTRLSERAGVLPSGYESLTDEELVHCFDREMEAGDNPYLRLPSSAEHRPWSDYRVTVDDKQGNAITRPTVEHFYSYWQVHQLAWIQQYPDLYKNARLIERIPEDDSVRKYRPWSPERERLVEFDGKRCGFDALSYWVTVYGRERGRTFASIAESDGIRRLDDRQAAAHRTRLGTLAGEVSARFNLAREDHYGFLRELIQLLEDYGRRERYKLAETLKRDILAWEDLLMLTTGETRDAVAAELEKTNIYDKRTFRHLDIATKERDYALEQLSHASGACSDAVGRLGGAQWSFTETDCNDLLNYCEQQGLGLFMTALSGMVAIGEDEYRQKFRRVQKYINLKNVLNSYEYLLKAVASQSGVISGKETLTPLVDQVMAQETWHHLFDAKKQQGLLSAQGTQDFLTNLGTLLADSQLQGTIEGYWAHQFLVMCLARNMTMHSYPNEDSYYGDLFGPMLDAAICATFYTWRLAKTNGWI